MTDKRGPGRPRLNEKKNDEENDAELIFKNIPHAYTVKVYRLEPEWCDGYAGQYNVGANRELSLEELKNRFGGSKFDLVVYNPGVGGILKRCQVHIDDFPRREGKILNRDGTTQDTPASTPIQSQANPIEKLMSLGLPPHLQKQATSFLLGTPEQVPEQIPQSNATADLMMQKMIMDMMNQSSRAQMEMMQQQMEMRQSMLRFQRDMEESAKPKNPLGDMDNMIKVIRELNGFKNELGGNENRPIAAQLIESVVPLVEGGFSEFLNYKKIQAQTDLARTMKTQNDRPGLPPRQTTEPRLSSAVPDPVEMAQEMGRAYKSMPLEKQNELMQVFLTAVESETDNNIEENNPKNTSNQYVAPNPESDTISLDDVLSDEDRAILNANKNEIMPSDVSNGKYAGTTETDYSSDRPGNPSGGTVSTH
jgi:hypothetical protein